MNEILITCSCCCQQFTRDEIIIVNGEALCRDCAEGMDEDEE
jgi:formylmethanofuran dehydrogenase subunit E